MDSKELLQPIINLFGCVDGGVGFALLYHDVVPGLIKIIEEGENSRTHRVVTAKELISALETVSEMCRKCLQ